jgi:mRNA interferase HigB
MRVIAWKPLRDFATRFPDALRPLKVWMKLMERGDFVEPAAIKGLFGGSVDFLPDNVTIFDIGGNKYRLIVKIEYRKHLVFVVAVLTHDEYNDWNRARHKKKGLR